MPRGGQGWTKIEELASAIDHELTSMPRDATAGEELEHTRALLEVEKNTSMRLRERAVDAEDAARRADRRAARAYRCLFSTAVISAMVAGIAAALMALGMTGGS